MLKLITIFLSLFLISACVDVIEFDLPSGVSDKLIVNGAVTTMAGPQEIRVFRTRDFDEAEGQSYPVRDAVVFVDDDLGNRYDYSLVADDLQKTFCNDLQRDLGPSNLDLARNYRYVSNSDFSGEIGRTYTLHVELADGTKVTSAPQLLKESIQIDDLEATYVIDQQLSEIGTEVPYDKWIVNARLDQSLLQDEEAYLTWRHKGTFRIATNPELYCDYRDCAPGVCVPSCCNECWVVEYGQTLVTTSANTLKNLSENALTVANIPIIAMRTASVYHLDLYQYRIASDVYDYYEALNQQLTNQGSIFDPPPYDEKSNLTYDDGREEPVLGYFWSAGVTHEVLTISPTTVTRQYNYFFPDDCQKVQGARTEKPSYYSN